jgi:hypothetical protein
MGIDEYKSELIEFLIEKESLNSFDETEHFYYWFFKSERVLRDNFKFLQGEKKPFIYKVNEKEFDLNTFDGIAKFVIEVKDINEIRNIFHNDLNLGKTEYFLRYSKKYKKLEYYSNTSSIRPVKKRNMCFVQHRKYNFFSINEKNYVLFYVGRSPRYVSNKNAIFLRPALSYNFNNLNRKEYESFLMSLNRRLVSIHQKTKIYNDQNFIKVALDLKDIKNKSMFNTKNIDELLSNITKGKSIPRILVDKFSKSEIAYLYNLINYEEVDKIIKFLYENIDEYKNIVKNSSYESNIIHHIVIDYLCKKFGLFDDKNFEKSIILDYVRMCSMQGVKLNLKIKSYKRLVQEHDELAFKISVKDIPEIKVNKKYPVIKSENSFEIEKIVDKKRLIIESEIQKHCVKTYSGSINSGKCCIYSFLDKRDNTRYTLEIKKKYDGSKNLVFFLNQIRGKFNANPPEYVLHEVYQILIKNKIYPSIIEANKDHKVLLDDIKDKKENNWVDPDIELPF